MIFHLGVRKALTSLEMGEKQVIKKQKGSSSASVDIYMQVND